MYTKEEAEADLAMAIAHGKTWNPWEPLWPKGQDLLNLHSRAEAMVAERIKERVVQHMAESIYVDLRGPLPREGMDVPNEGTDNKALVAELREAADSLRSASQFLRDKKFSTVASAVYMAALRAEKASGL